MLGTIDTASVIISGNSALELNNNCYAEYYYLLSKLAKRESAMPSVVLVSSKKEINSLKNFGCNLLSQIISEDDDAFMLLERMRRLRSSKEVRESTTSASKVLGKGSISFIGDIDSDNYLTFFLNISFREQTTMRSVRQKITLKDNAKSLAAKIDQALNKLTQL